MTPLDALLTEALPFWEGLAPQEQQLLLDTAVPSTIPKGTITHRADQDCKGIMLVLAGQLRAYILSEEGREVTLYRVQGGDTCVMSSSCLMDAIVFDVLIQAMEDTQVVTLPVTALSALSQRHPEVELFLYKTASERFSDIMWTMQQILFMGMDRRAAIFLWDEYTRQGPVLSMTHEEMARYIGSAREVVTKVLKYFAQEGIVSLRRGRSPFWTRRNSASWRGKARRHPYGTTHYERPHFSGPTLCPGYGRGPAGGAGSRWTLWQPMPTGAWAWRPT